MKARLEYSKIAPEAFQIMLQFEKYARSTGFDPLLIELIKIRASQLNGCAYCLDMHTIDARAHGETEQRIYCISVWHDSPFYSDTERVVLELTEAVTNIGKNGVPDDLYNRVREHFDKRQYVDLIYIINTINSWNRLSISMGSVPGNYTSSVKK